MQAGPSGTLSSSEARCVCAAKHTRIKSDLPLVVKVCIILSLTDLGTPPLPPRVWKIGILQEMLHGIPENFLSYPTRSIPFVKGI